MNTLSQVEPVGGVMPWLRQIFSALPTFRFAKARNESKRFVEIEDDDPSAVMGLLFHLHDNGGSFATALVEGSEFAEEVAAAIEGGFVSPSSGGLLALTRKGRSAIDDVLNSDDPLHLGGWR